MNSEEEIQISQKGSEVEPNRLSEVESQIEHHALSEEESQVEHHALYDEIHHIWKDKIDYDMQKGVFFGLRGFIGKVCLQSRIYEPYEHPAQLESKIMKLICPTHCKNRKKYQRFLPRLMMHRSLSITDPLLYALPMRSFGLTIHPRCDVIVVPKYEATLSDLRDRKLLDLESYRSIIFQILYTLFMLQRQYGFMHNDLHVQNILMKRSKRNKNDRMREYAVGNIRFQIPNQQWVPILWDFEDSRCHKVPALSENIKTNNTPEVPPGWCAYYDAHFLLISIIDVGKNDIPREVKDWVLSMYPERAIPPRAWPNSGVPTLHERKLQLAQYESKRLIGLILEGQTLPASLHENLATYWNEVWGDDGSSTTSSLELESADRDWERHYDNGDNYYDYLKSELPRDGVTWDAEIHDLCVQAKEDVTLLEKEPLLDNRLTNTFEDRDTLPTVLQLLTSDFFHCFRLA